MLRVNVGLSRKLSKDYNSTGYSVNLEGELTAHVNDPEAVVVQAKEIYDLAEEILATMTPKPTGSSGVATRKDLACSTTMIGCDACCLVSSLPLSRILPP